MNKEIKKKYIKYLKKKQEYSSNSSKIFMITLSISTGFTMLYAVNFEITKQVIFGIIVPDILIVMYLLLRIFFNIKKQKQNIHNSSNFEKVNFMLDTLNGSEGLPIFLKDFTSNFPRLAEVASLFLADAAIFKSITPDSKTKLEFENKINQIIKESVMNHNKTDIFIDYTKINTYNNIINKHIQSQLELKNSLFLEANKLQEVISSDQIVDVLKDI